MLTNSNIHSSVATNSKLPTSIINLPNNPKNHQLLGNSNHTNGLINSNIQSHPIPPRYQPPPQPSGGNPPNSNGQISGGILKNFGLKQPVSYYHQSSDLHHSATGNHINLKYPPEIPKLTNIYLPDSLKNSNGGSGASNNNNNNNNQSRLIPPRAGGNISGTNTVNNLRLSSSGIHPPSRVNQQQQQTVQIHQQPQRIQSEEAEFVQRQPQTSQEMLKFVRKCETESTQTGGTTVPQNTQNNVGIPIGRLTAEQNRHFQSLISELRALKEANQRLSDDNQELRDLCCFLDDDRQKGRKLAREWQRFGRYTASVMRQEVSAYQSKLRQLDDKQQELIRDNLELKELCLYLDEERANALSSNNPCQACGTTVPVATVASHLRDDGDGSSSSTNADEPMPNIRQFERNNITELNLRPTLNDQTLQYVRSLEQRILQLEEEQTANGSTMNPTHEQNTNDPISGRPEAVVRALQVLEVREQLERDRIGGMPTQSTEQIMDDGEKALVREMCNVVWRKLEDNTNGPGGIDQI